VPDEIFDNPRLAAVYDDLDPDRSDLDVYAAIAQKLGARHVLDIGCGTGTFALLLADAGLQVTGVDPAAASLAVARRKPGADRVRWILGDARALPPLQVDLVTMTGNVAQAIVEQDDWQATLAGAHAALRTDGWLVFETRVPARRAWESWNPAESYLAVDIPGVGLVESWEEVVDVSLPLVRFRSYTSFASDGTTLVSDSTLRFREQDEVRDDLAAHGFAVAGIGDAPDRPGREWVFRARRLGEADQPS
jgi:SAM-dependent methyltransferase